MKQVTEYAVSSEDSKLEAESVLEKIDDLEAEYQELQSDVEKLDNQMSDTGEGKDPLEEEKEL